MSYRYMLKLAFINIFKKKKRTFLSIFSTLLSTVIIFCALILFENVTSLQEMQKSELSHYHYAVNTNEELQLTSRYQIAYERKLEEDHLYSLDFQNEVIPLILVEGRFPNHSKEILVSENSTINLEGYEIVGRYKEEALFKEIHDHQEIAYTVFDEGTICKAYIYDPQVYHFSSYTNLVSQLDVSSSDLYTHDQLISVDTIKTYMKDTSLISIFYLVIIGLCIMMSLISIHNVLLISDQTRKKEIGLLKSVGAKPKAIAFMLKGELCALALIGTLLGLGLGMISSYYILNQFIESLYLSFDIKMIFSPIITFISMMTGFLLMYLSGIYTYRKYLKSSPIEDLKDYHYDFMPPLKVTQRIVSNFGWQMFVIYNRRMKKQTRNIQTSFCLLIVTSIMFLAVVFSTIVFQNQNTDKTCDFEIKSVLSCHPEVSDALKLLTKNGDLGITNFETNRTLTMGFRTDPASYDDWYNELNNYKKESNIIYYEATDKVGDEWVNVYHYPTAFDQDELDMLRPYVIEGSLDHLTEREVIAVFRDSYLGKQFCDNFKVGDIVAYYYWYDESGPTTPKTKDMAMKMLYGRRLSAIVVLPSDVVRQMGYLYNQHERIMGFTLESGFSHVELEIFTFNLKNKGNSIEVEEQINELLVSLGANDMYQVTNIALEIENNRFASFIMQVLLYPLFMMLFVVSLMNIHNVLSGNLLLKQNDIAIMRLVGIGNKQLRLMLMYEYLEGYMNASLVATLFFLPFIMIENKFGLLSSFKLADNIMGTMIFAICFLGIILLIPLIIANIKKFQNIKAIEAISER